MNSTSTCFFCKKPIYKKLSTTKDVREELSNILGTILSEFKELLELILV